MGKQADDKGPAELRIDKWLWAARFFKTRSAAVEALNGGKVHLNGARVKPARAVRPGDMLRIRRGPYEMELEVIGINAQRRPFSEARLLYAETEESAVARAALADERRLLAQAGAGTADGRPNKKQRRQIHRFRDSMN